MNFTIEFIVITAMIIFTAVFVAYEMALASISRSKLTYLVKANRPGAAEALYMKDRMEASLAVVQVGVTLLSAIAAATGGAGINEQLTPYLEHRFGLANYWAEIISLVTLIIPLSAFTIIFAELIPKTFALKHNEWVILTLSGPMKYITLVFYPIIAGLENIVKAVMRFISRKAPAPSSAYDPQSSLHELTAALSLARSTRLIDAHQEKIVLAAAQLSLRPIKDIMIQAADISVIPVNSTLTDALLSAHLDMHTRFPVCSFGRDLQTVQGYINFKDIIAALQINPENPTIKGIIRPMSKFADHTPISKVLERMILEKLHIGLVENSEGRAIGLITQEDIIEELVGDIEDEFDRLPHFILPYGHQWLVGGAVPMANIAKTLDLDWPADQDQKLADWGQKQFPLPLKGGEVITQNGLQITVRKLRRNKISEAFVSKMP